MRFRKLARASPVAPLVAVWAQGVRADFRTPMTGAEPWCVALKKRGTPVELVRHPRAPHELSRSGGPWLPVDRRGRLRQWLEHWVTQHRRATTSGNGAGR